MNLPFGPLNLSATGTRVHIQLLNKPSRRERVSDSRLTFTQRHADERQLKAQTTPHLLHSPFVEGVQGLQTEELPGIQTESFELQHPDKRLVPDCGCAEDPQRKVSLAQKGFCLKEQGQSGRIQAAWLHR